MTARPSEVLERIDNELRAIWSCPPPPGEMPKARACTMNLVVVAASPELAAQWAPVIDDVVQGIPARAIVVGLDPDGADALEGDATAVCAVGQAGGPVVCSERVSLVARGAVCTRLFSCVDGLCANDVPTALVWLGRIHPDDPAFEPLAREAGRIVLDGAHGSLSSLAHVVRWARSRPTGQRPGVADLAWTRLGPWQELCARMFDEPRVRLLADHIARVQVVQASPAGAPIAAEGALMLSWLATRLGWKAGSIAGKLRLVRPRGGHLHVQLRSDGAGHVPRGSLMAMEVEAADGTLSMRGSIVRDSTDADAAAWRLEVTAGDDVQRIEQHVRLRAGDAARLLERTLRRPPEDEALAEAVAWANELRGEEIVCI